MKKCKDRLEAETFTAYRVCFFYLHHLIFSGYINKIKQLKVKITDLDLENWYKPEHYEAWKKKYGNDWRQVLKK